MVTYDTLIDTTQEQVSSILKANSTVKTITSKVLPGTPYTSIQSKIGFPYIKVETPTLETTKKCFGGVENVSVTCPIRCYNTKASRGRELADAVRKAIKDARGTTVTVELDNNKFPSTEHSEALLTDSKTILYTDSVIVTYLFWGEVDD